MRRFLKVTGLALFLGACGSDDAAQCELPTGAWMVRYVETSGDCEAGDALDQLVPFTDDSRAFEGAPDGCRGQRFLSDDNCEWTIDLDCDLYDGDGQKIGTSRNVAEIQFGDSDRFEGVAERSFSFSDGTSCKSQFDVIGTPR